VPLSERIVTFVSGDTQLRGKLVMPQGSGPHPTVLFIGGFEKTSVVDGAFEPYLYASRGFATLVYDNRGTGGSQGEYSQNFRVLATDALAALKWLREQPGIDGARVNLVGMSEGGWVAPMVAARDERARSVLIGSGPLVSAFEADRWGYVRALKSAGFEDAIPKADRINDILSDIVDRGQDRWSDLGSALNEAHSERWFDALAGSNSLLGEVAHSALPLWAQRLKLRKNPPFTDRLYDPVPTASALKMPSYWIFGEQDSTMPTEWTIEALNKLQRQRKPVDYLTYPEAGHGILRIEQPPDGNSRVLGYEPDYIKVQIDWLRRNNSPQIRFSEPTP
jgi:pimeloyl-ACP methyl ester carboxylesterase